MLKLITPPAVPIVELAGAKAHLRVDLNTEDVMIETLVAASTRHAEDYTRRAFLTQTWQLTLDEFPEEDFIKIPLPPLDVVNSVKYYDDDDTEYTMDVADYYVDTFSEPGRVVLRNEASWPTDTLRAANGVIINFDCGWGIADDVPGPIYQAVLIMLNHLYDNRDLIVQTGAMPKEIPRSFESLLWPYRVIEFS
jgi:uncharacterized phiE125 gp8 family phage protein